LSRFLLFVYLLEAGLLLLVVPWTVFWERNFFVEQVPGLSTGLLNPFVRGAISGLGLVCLLTAFAELRALWQARPTGGTGGASTSSAPGDLPG
jgi:hypothetical protein